MEMLLAMVPEECRHCGAKLRWELNHEGFPVALDAEPTLYGNVVIEEGKARVVAPCNLAAARIAGFTLYNAHSTTCPTRGNGKTTRGQDA